MLRPPVRAVLTPPKEDSEEKGTENLTARPQPGDQGQQHRDAPGGGVPPGQDVTETALHLCALSPSDPGPSLMTREHQTSPTEGHSAEHLASTPQNRQGRQRQGTSEQPPQQGNHRSDD